jgi:hypothetical protein
LFYATLGMPNWVDGVGTVSLGNRTETQPAAVFPGCCLAATYEGPGAVSQSVRAGLSEKNEVIADYGARFGDGTEDRPAQRGDLEAAWIPGTWASVARIFRHVVLALALRFANRRIPKRGILDNERCREQPTVTLQHGPFADQQLAAMCKALAYRYRVDILRFLVSPNAFFAGEIDGRRRCYCVEPNVLALLKQ